MTLESTQPLTEMSTRVVFWRIKRPMCSDDNLSTFICWLFWYVGVSNSWKPQGQFRPLQKLLYLYLCLLNIYMYSTRKIWVSIKRTHLLCKSSRPLFFKRNNSAFHWGSTRIGAQIFWVFMWHKLCIQTLEHRRHIEGSVCAREASAE
jgi:hypothetical protein